MAIIDLANLLELLAENPDVADAPNAKPIPAINEEDPYVVVEFDNVVFHYPTQPSNKGLKGLSFEMKKGTTRLQLLLVQLVRIIMHVYYLCHIIVVSLTLFHGVPTQVLECLERCCTCE